LTAMSIITRERIVQMSEAEALAGTLKLMLISILVKASIEFLV